MELKEIMAKPYTKGAIHLEVERFGLVQDIWIKAKDKEEAKTKLEATPWIYNTRRRIL